MDKERRERLTKTTGVRLAMEAKETLRQVEEEFPDNPQAMKYFYDLFRNAYSGIGMKSNGLKRIGTLCIQAPEELIRAAGAVPVRLCSGSHAFDQVGAEFMPVKSCSMVKATLGMLSLRNTSDADKIELVVNPTTCEQKKKAGELLEEFGYRVHNLEMPPSKDSEEARIYWQRSVKKFARVLEEVTGVRITKQRLAEAIKTTGLARAAYRRLHELMKSSLPVIRGKDMMLVTNAYFFDDLERWTKAVADLGDELEQRRRQDIAAAGKHAPRILFTGSPPIFPNLKLLLLIEQTGGVIVADEVCSSSRLLYDLAAYDEQALYDMVPAVADRALKPCTCPVFLSSQDRIRRLLDLAGSFGVDGVVYQSFAGCMPYELEQRSVGKALAKANIPMLSIETDYSPDDHGQLSTRVEAFIESLKGKARKRS
jgi:benzoyl-CoA reductase/2-hydroxyglutaryl-CoA dehydratase subunit BcrC/BadD/HgdB